MFGKKSKPEPIQTSQPIVTVDVEYKLRSDGYFAESRKATVKMTRGDSEDINRITEKVEWFEDKPGQVDVQRWRPNA